ncbi:MAG: manganese catalase family protein [Clostridia bacterium]|nr:manganese catalase family protein [Clostridia bacterium]MDD4375630.1 manganese catalase family protein [Clostridia bacterium]
MGLLFKSELPYPEIKVEGKNSYYAGLLLDDYAGDISECTAIFLYIFQHMYNSKIYKEYAEILRNIAIVEMIHLELLGEAIMQLGTTPKFSSIKLNRK